MKVDSVPFIQIGVCHNHLKQPKKKGWFSHVPRSLWWTPQMNGWNVNQDLFRRSQDTVMIDKKKYRHTVSLRACDENHNNGQELQETHPNQSVPGSECFPQNIHFQNLFFALKKIKPKQIYVDLWSIYGSFLTGTLFTGGDFQEKIEDPNHSISGQKTRGWKDSPINLGVCLGRVGTSCKRWKFVKGHENIHIV